jgi:DNA-binding NtrC family response regulator
VLRRLTEKGSHIKVIVQATAAGSDRVADALRAGALDFLVKPAAPERLVVTIRNALRLAALEDEVSRTRRADADLTRFDDIVTSDPGMEKTVTLARRAAGSGQPVLIEGEAGTGKAMLARAIHEASDRGGRPFVTVSCDQAEPEGALFGADRETGRIQAARSGTLLVEEIAHLPLDEQAKLMTLLSTGFIEPPSGGKGPVRADIRLIATTGEDLQARVRAGRFREDLYYRLNILPIRVPPLRARSEAIPELARRFVTRFAAAHGRPVHGIAAEAVDRLCRRPWPGNVGELEAAILRAVMVADGPHLTPADFPGMADPRHASARHAVTGPAAPEPREPAASAGVSVLDAQGEVRPLAEIEAAVIELALDRYRGRMATVARKLGIGRSTLYRKLKELGMSEDAEKIAAE